MDAPPVFPNPPAGCILGADSAALLDGYRAAAAETMRISVIDLLGCAALTIAWRLGGRCGLRPRPIRAVSQR